VFLEKQERHAEALAAFECAARLGPNDSEILCNVGKALARAGRREEALDAHERAITADEANADAWFHKGVQLRHLGRLAEALDAFAVAAASETFAAENPGACANLGHVAQLLGHHDRARSALARAIELYTAQIEQNTSGRAEALYWRASTHALLGDRQEMLEDLEEAIRWVAKFAANARAETDFQAFWQDADFVRITT
jgi:Tfp pilus assembly protein PilF